MRAGDESTYPSLEAYTADIKAARNAYAADMAVLAGRCAVCQTSKRDGHKRLCWVCRHEGKREQA